MKITFIRNATVHLTYGNVRFLIDPYLGDKEAYPGFGPSESALRNPRIPLSTAMIDILATDVVIVTHTHSDHWDAAAVRLLPKDLPIYAQHAADATLIRSQGFLDVRVLDHEWSYAGVTLTKVPGQHGSPQALQIARGALGEVCGVVFRHPGETTLYVAGDSVWNSHVENNLTTHAPSVVVLNTGDAQVPGLGSITMGKEDVRHVYEASPDSTLIAVHMEALNHCTLTRSELRTYAEQSGMSTRLLIPAENETYWL